MTDQRQIVAEPKVQHRVAAGSAGAAALIIAISGPMIQGYEGTRTTAYLDPIGIVTACTGHTEKGLVLGEKFTAAQCTTILSKDQQGFMQRIVSCTKGEAPIETWAAMVSFSFNVGSSTYCKKFAPLIDQGNLAAACAKLSLYVNANGKPLPGLVKRRAGERAVCERGLSTKA